MPTLHGGCHCGAVRYSVAIDDGARLRATYCHCSDCRLTIGFFCGLYAAAPAAAFTLTANRQDAIVHYNASAAYARTHCGICGASVGSALDQKTVYFLASTLDLPDGDAAPRGMADFIDVAGHIYVGSTPAGGITRIIDDDLPRWLQFSTSPEWALPADAPGLERKLKLEVENGEKLWGEELRGSCHCKGIQFVIRRPPEDYLQDPVLKDWTKLGRRLAAIHCFCDTCRKVSGAPFWTWVFTPRKLLTFTSNSTERIYHSHPTKSIDRRFCGRCGCTFSYAAREDMWDISAATLDQPQAEGWLTFAPTPDGKDPADAALGTYIHGWLDHIDSTERPLSYAQDGERYNPALVTAVRRGRAKCDRL